jgi:phosphinothricin acetyltransferase
MDPLGQIIIRPSIESDVPRITEIYRWHVLNGTGTFEIEPPDEAEMARRRAELVGKMLPWLVAQAGNDVCAYAYANVFRPRPAYRFCMEDSIYVDQACAGRGLGRLLLAELLAICEAHGARQMLAVIGDSQNAASIAVHRALGFAPSGKILAAGWKFDRWLDVVLMQKRLGLGSDQRPDQGAT